MAAENFAVSPVQRRLLVPLVVVLLVLVGGFDALLLMVYYDGLNNTSQLLLSRAAIEVDESIAEQSETLEAIQNVIIREEYLAAALKAQDRDTLLEIYGPLFAKLRASYGITHFYFHRPDLINLLRIHQPERRGDFVNRFTLREAQRTGKMASGIELGSMGMLTLRTVMPVVDGETLLGYIELGKEIEDILHDVRTELGIELAATILKSHVKRELWESGMMMLGRHSDWNQLPDEAVIYSSVNDLPEAAKRFLASESHHDHAIADLEFDGKSWRALATPLIDASGAKVGNLFAFENISKATAQFNRMIVFSSAMAVMLACVLIVFLYFALKRVDRWIKVSAIELVEARKTADCANKAKSEFLANMSHEIRTPMTAILGFTENMLHDGQSNSDKLNCINTIRRNGKQLMSLINDILDISKIESGKMQIEQTDCQPCKVIADVAALMKVRADAKGFPLCIEYIGTIPETIQSDPTRIRQILINLIGNAIKFTEVGSVRLVTRFINDHDEPFMQFDIIDTGLGMTQDQVDILFQPFMQADNSTTRNFGGTGLGLTISKRLAQLLGGDISIPTTNVGRGTTFRATVSTGIINGVKMLEDPMADTIVLNASRDIEHTLPTTLSGIHILLAEDGQDNQRLISYILKRAGAEVTVKENGKLAMEAALAARDEGKPFDCLLLDMQMPVMDGYHAARQLRIQDYAGLIIALTANAMASDRKKCINAGCDDFTTKPIDRKLLVEAIQRNLELAKNGSDLRYLVES